jgi:hypothetical protein
VLRWVTVVVGCLLAAARPAEGIGFGVGPDGWEMVGESALQAVIFQDQGTEEIILQASFPPTDRPLVWALALPRRPTVSVAGAEAYSALRRVMGERGRLDGPGPGRDLFPYIPVFAGDSLSRFAVAPPGNPAILRGWFERNGLTRSGTAYAACRRQLERGRWLVLVRVEHYAGTPRRQLNRSVTAGPLRIRFGAPRPLLPLDWDSTSGGVAWADLYVVHTNPFTVAGPGRKAWTVSFARPGPVPLPLASRYPWTTGRDFWISRLRRESDSPAGEAIRLAPYDPMPVPGVEALRDQAAAIACLGLLDRRDAVGPLEELLATGDPERADAGAAMCALARLGVREVVPRLLDFAEHGGWNARRNALFALGLLDVREAVPYCLAGLTRTQETGTDTLTDRVRSLWMRMNSIPAMRERLLCIELLQEHGDSTCLAPLRRMLADSLIERLPRPAKTRPRPLPRTCIRAALAGLGDPDAYRSFRDDLAREAGDIYPGSRHYLGSIVNGRPPPGLKVVHEMDHLFPGAPEVRERLLREVSRDPTVPPFYRALLVTRLASPGPEDLAVLDRILEEGLSRAAPEISFRGRAFPGAVRETMDVDVSAALYAMGRPHETDRLLAVWWSEAGRRAGIRGEVAFALAATPSPNALPALLEYVTTDWDRAARSPEFASYLAGSAEELPRDTVRALGALDLRNRSGAISRYMRAVGGPRVLRRLAADPRLHPYLRLFWLIDLAGANRRRYGVSDPGGVGMVLLAKVAPEAVRLPAGAKLIEEARGRFRGDIFAF